MSLSLLFGYGSHSCLLPLFLLANLFSVHFVSSRFPYFVHFLLYRVYFLLCFVLLLLFYSSAFCNRSVRFIRCSSVYVGLTGSGVNRSNSENENKNSSGQRNIYIHDEPPHFNLRFTAPDYNNTSQRIKRNNCWDFYFHFSCFMPGHSPHCMANIVCDFSFALAVALANARLWWKSEKWALYTRPLPSHSILCVSFHFNSAFFIPLPQSVRITSFVIRAQRMNQCLTFANDDDPTIASYGSYRRLLDAMLEPRAPT